MNSDSEEISKYEYVTSPDIRQLQRLTQHAKLFQYTTRLHCFFNVFWNVIPVQLMTIEGI